MAPRIRFRYRLASLRSRKSLGRGVEGQAKRDRKNRADSGVSRYHGRVRGRMLDRGAGETRRLLRERKWPWRKAASRGERLWGASDIYQRLQIGDDLGDAAIRHALEMNVLGFLQGATWPVRLLARGQINTFLFGEILLVETGIVPLMLLEKDRRALHRNMFTRAKLLTPEHSNECAQLIDRIETAVRNADRSAMRDAHIEIFRQLCRLGRAAFERYGLEFPPRVEEEMVDFYKREWPIPTALPT